MQTEHKIRTLAHQLTDILGVYAHSFAQWCEDPADLCRYERTHANLDLVRVLTGQAFPGGRGELGELLLCHAELKLLVLRRHLAGLPPGQHEAGPQSELLGRHALLVAALRAVCAQRSRQSPPLRALSASRHAARRPSVPGP